MKKIAFTLQLLMVIWFGCSPEDGQDGAIGPQGPQGQQGIQGPTGEDGQDGAQGEQGEPGQDGSDGEQGETGTANVIYSDWFTLGFPDDINATNYVESISAPDVTEEIINSGLVLIYARLYAIDPVVPRQLPYSAFFQQQYYSPGFRAPTPTSPTGRVFVTILSMDGSPIGAPIFEEYRYIIIPGGLPSSGKSSTDYTKMSYEEVVARFNIPE